MTDEKISVVIPVYNSEAVIDELHKRLTGALEKLAMPYEIILVNDCSPDNTWKKMEAISRSDRQVKSILLRKNAGYDNAIMAGLRFAGGDFIIIMDDDLQHAPEDIGTLVNEIRPGYDVVYALFVTKKQSITKNIGSWMNGKLAQHIINKPAEIYLSPFKIIRREVLEQVVRYDGPFPYIDGLLFQVTSSIHQIVVPHHERAVGEGSHDIRRSLRIIFNFCTTFSILPLRLLFLSGLLIFSLSCGISLGLVIWKLIYGFDVEGWASIMLVVITLGGFQLMALGLIGEYLGRAYMNLNKQPQYVIKQVEADQNEQPDHRIQSRPMSPSVKGTFSAWIPWGANST